MMCIYDIFTFKNYAIIIHYFNSYNIENIQNNKEVIIIYYQIFIRVYFECINKFELSPGNSIFR